MKSQVIYPAFKFIYDLTLQILIVFLIFASIGLNFFGGSINSFSLDLYNEDMNLDLNYEYLNFNTFINSLVFLFVVITNNDWPVLANICIADSGNTGNRRLLRFVFIFFKFFINYLLLNSILAFLMEILYVYQKKKQLKNGSKPIKDFIWGENILPFLNEKNKWSI